MKTKFTLEKYNKILEEYQILCVPVYGMSDTDIINKRKNYTHYCAVCDKEFRITPYKLLKSKQCIYDHTNITPINEVNKHDSIMVPVIPTKEAKEPTLTIQDYINNLPKHIKYKQSIRSIKTPIRHRCNKCYYKFRITPRAFHEYHYKCPHCHQ